MSTHHAEKAEPREVVDTITITWIARTEPIRCDCGHDHFGRVPTVHPANEWTRWLENYAPQWHFCEEPDCGCDRLRHTRTRPEGRADQ